MELQEYDEMLIGARTKISAYYNTEPGGGNELISFSIIRYAIEKVLGWTPEEAIKKFDDYIIRKMLLEKVITYIIIPVEMQGEEATYILSRLYPKLLHFSTKQLIEKQYENILYRHKQFPRDYFIGTDGFYRYCVCFRYLCYHFKRFKNIEEMYEFTLSPEGKRFMYSHRLFSPAMQLDIDMVEVVYEITKNKPHAKLFYTKYALLQALKKKKEGKGNW